VYERVKGGAQLSDAFDEQGDLVPRVYTASLMAGERSGNLEVVLRRYVAYAKLMGSVRRKTISALMYPIVLLALAVVVVGIIVLRLVPAFAMFYSSFGADLPLGTRIIMRVSAFIREYALILVVALATGAAFITSWVRRPAERQRIDRALLRLPWVGDIARKFATSQMARTLSTLLSGGIPLVQALDVASRSVGNRFVAHELEGMGQRVREGESLAGTMRARRIFPDVAVKMTEVGEATGALQDMLNSLADFYDEDLQSSLERFVTLIEPVLLIILGLVIASLLLALYLPLFQLSSVVH
jgi:type IV pilus assembly protein PilC